MKVEVAEVPELFQYWVIVLKEEENIVLLQSGTRGLKEEIVLGSELWNLCYCLLLILG